MGDLGLDLIRGKDPSFADVLLRSLEPLPKSKPIEHILATVSGSSSTSLRSCVLAILTFILCYSYKYTSASAGSTNSEPSRGLPVTRSP